MSSVVQGAAAPASDESGLEMQSLRKHQSRSRKPGCTESPRKFYTNAEAQVHQRGSGVEGLEARVHSRAEPLL